MCRFLLLALCISLALLAQGMNDAKGEDARPGSAKSDFFEKSVRPILVTNCFECHGSQKQKGGLRLDSRAAILTGGDSGPAAVPGKPQESLLITAIGYQDSPRMPPKHKLKDEEIAALTSWIEQGIPWPDSIAKARARSTSTFKITEEDRQFWSFRPVNNPPLPKVRNSSWPKTPVDDFVLAELEANHLRPVGPADKRTLIRRATFDLIGLPPSVEEIEAFLKDERPGAFARVVDRLLASPHYGERWGRHWLDVARYGEDQAHTFQARKYPSGYRYRDWLVRALNEDMPYDRFILQQIAGDLLDEPGRIERLPALGFFALGPVYYGDRQKLDQLADRIDTCTRGFLGLTVACARCHDHKFDPIPTSDYYALAGVFASTEYTEAPLAPSPVVEVYERAAAAVEAQNRKIEKLLVAEAAGLAKAMTPKIGQYILAVWRLHNLRKSHPETALPQIAKKEGLDSIFLQRWVTYLTPPAIGKRPHLARWFQLLEHQDPKADLSTNQPALAEAREVAQAFQNYVQSLLRLRAALEEHYALTLANSVDQAKSKQPRPALDESEAALLEEIIGAKGLFANPKSRLEKSLSADARSKLVSLRADLEELQKKIPAKYPVAHALMEAAHPANMRVCIRGNAETLGEEVPRRFLAVLGGEQAPFTKGSGRLELARAIASKNNPLTARVMINRIWQHHFGKGLVRTASNFGALGERPTHPKLLDYLANRFMASGWSIKAVHREIMLSATYQLSSELDAENYEKDPEARLLWRMNRRRMEVEAWRDAMLAVAGNLDATIGGPSIDLATPENRRRTFYAAVSRHDLSGLLRLFDFPDPNITSSERNVTTVPLQQLYVMNSEFVIRTAKALAVRLTAGSNEDDASRIRRAFLLLYGRPATARELQLGLEYLTMPQAPSDDRPGHDGKALTPWEEYAQVLLSANELLYID